MEGKFIQKLCKGASEGQGLFYKYEEFIKERLADIGSLPIKVVILRCRLYQKNIPSGCTQDGIIAFDVVLAGYKVAYESNAITTEEYNLSIMKIFKEELELSQELLFNTCRPAIFNPLKSGTYFYHILNGRLLDG